MTKQSIFLAFSFANALHASKPIILWDIHHVLLQRDSLIDPLFHSPWWNIIMQSSASLLKDLTVLGITHTISPHSSEEFIQLARDHHNQPLIDLIIKISNAQHPFPGMQAIVNELYEQGYEQHIASNIGKTVFDALIDPRKYPHLAPLFAPMNIQKSHVVTSQDGIFIKKPDPAFFREYLEKNSIDLATQPIIFIDDNAQNVAAAQSVGMDAILFENPEQLRNTLQARNILLPASPSYTHHSVAP